MTHLHYRFNRLWWAALLFFAIAPAETLARQVAPEMAILQPSDSHRNDWFGYRVSMSGRRAAISAFFNTSAGDRSGSVYVFQENASDDWTQVQQLHASDQGPRMYFGAGVWLDGDRLLIGAPAEDRGDPDGPMQNAGAAYIFDRDAATGQWVESFKMTAADAAKGDWFGDFVALRGDVAVVGADFKDGSANDMGAAYVFERQPDGSWTQTAKLAPAELGGNDWFGFPIALGEGQMVIGASLWGRGEGTAFVFERDGAGAWTQTATLANPDPDNAAWFGAAIAMQGETVLVGAPEGGTRDGVVYVFERNASGEWPLVATLHASDRQPQIGFGYSVTMSGDLAVIGTNMDDRSAQFNGVAYIFKRDPATGVWTEQAQLTASNHGNVVDQYGWSVALDHDCLVVSSLIVIDGAPQGNVAAGTAYIYDLSAYITAVETDVLPTDFVLEQNYPNPFNPSTHIAYALQKAGNVHLTVHDILGRVVRRIDTGLRAAGRYELPFDAGNLTTGVYTYRLVVDGQVAARRMILAR